MPQPRPTEETMKILVLSFLLAAVVPVKAETTNSLPKLTLAEARELALRNHPRIAAANYRALAAEQVVRESRAGYFPQASLLGSAVGANSSSTRLEAGGLNNPTVFDRAAGGLAVSQLITDFGRTANLTASSKFEARAANQTTEATREEVLLTVESEYFAALQAQAVFNVARQTLDTRQLLLDQVGILASNKLKSELDVSFARVAVEEARLLLEKAQNQEDASQAALAAALGERTFQRYQLEENSVAFPTPTNAVEMLVQTALQIRPELVALRDDRESAWRLARAQKDARLPVIAAVGTAGGSPIHDSRLPDTYAAGGLQFSVPLFAGGLYTARQHEAELRAQADEELLRDAEDNVIRDVRVAWLNLNDAVQRLQTTAQLLIHANEAFELAQARYQAGSSSIVELSQAQLELVSAQISGTTAHYDVLIRKAELDYQTGALSSPQNGLSP